MAEPATPRRIRRAVVVGVIVLIAVWIAYGALMYMLLAGQGP